MLSSDHAEAHVMEVNFKTDRSFYFYCLDNLYRRGPGVVNYDFVKEGYIYRASEMYLEFVHPTDAT